MRVSISPSHSSAAAHSSATRHSSPRPTTPNTPRFAGDNSPLIGIPASIAVIAAIILGVDSCQDNKKTDRDEKKGLVQKKSQGPDVNKSATEVKSKGPEVQWKDSDKSATDGPRRGRKIIVDCSSNR